ncbi:MAG: polymer-forming cytoskeletal protein [Nitrospinota bacterium]|jgi:cytoskeletal protein CcmA (bactofilin family)|nr:polymer-forming cytoskeletal protein [Nitrospinota bacterium]MDP6618091.1 polymer-forming cytoskeletal protein [Nitrospinota bacterium]MDP7384693.1 polymer-forming cytoskeletal protein [Nitrospinota bacterium]
MSGGEANRQDEARSESRTETDGAPGSRSSFIADGVTMDGKISGRGDLVIGGTVTGEIRQAANQVTIEKGGRVEADIQGESIIVEGSFKGKLTAKGLVIVKETARLEGELKAARIQMEDGAKLKGSVELTQ